MESAYSKSNCGVTMKTIVSFSGGLDSIYVLWKELTETTNDVLAVYFVSPVMGPDSAKYKIKSMNSNSASIAIAAKIPSLCNLIKSKTRPFDLSIVYYDLAKLVDPSVGSNNTASLRMRWAVDRLNMGMADRFVAGNCRENDSFGHGDRSSKDGQTGSNASMIEFKDIANRGEYVFPLFDMNYTLAHAYAELPQDVSGSHLSCDIPNAEEPCGVCFKCSYHQLMKKKLADGNTPEQIFDFFMEKSVMSNGMWCSPKKWVYEELNVTYNLGEVNPWPMPQWPNSYKVPE